MMTIKNRRLAGLLAAPAVAAAIFGAGLTLAGTAGADTSIYNSPGGSSYGTHSNTQIVVTPNTYANPAPYYTPWATWYN